MRNGHDPEQFWRVTFRQVELVFAGDRERREDEQAIAYYQAYMSGVFSQSYDKGKFPSYEKMAPWKKSKGIAKAQTWAQQKMIAQALNAAFGGTLSKRGE